MTDAYLHGIDVVELEEGPRPIESPAMSVIGLVGTAPAARAGRKAWLLTPSNRPATWLRWQAVAAGLSGNDISVAISVPSKANQGLDVKVVGKRITVSLATGSTPGLSISRPGHVAAAVTNHTAASALVTCVLESGTLGATIAEDDEGNPVISDDGTVAPTDDALDLEAGEALELAGAVISSSEDYEDGVWEAVEEEGETLPEAGTSGYPPAILPLLSARRLAGGRNTEMPLDQPRLYLSRPSRDAIGDTGTIPAALDAIYDQGDARVVVVRVTEGVDATETRTNIMGDGSADTGVHALASASSRVGLTPRILIAPGYSQMRVVAQELVGVAERLRAVVVADCPAAPFGAGVRYRGNFGSDRLYLVWPQVHSYDHTTGTNVATWASPRVAGTIARTDGEIGWWASPSNREILGVAATARPVPFTLGDANCRANYLNEHDVSTIVRSNGYRLWGNRTTADDPKWAFLCVRRTADALHQALLGSLQWAVDRGITRTFVEDVTDSVNAYLDTLIRKGAIIGGRCWADAELNTPEEVAQGRVYFDFDFTPTYPAERITFRSHLTHEYLREVFAPPDEGGEGGGGGGAAG